MNAETEMPKYKCHKEVHALKIKDIMRMTEESFTEGDDPVVSHLVTPVEEGYAPFSVDDAWFKKHEPQAGGYYVVYADGYKLYSPADAFEDGYTLIE